MKQNIHPTYYSDAKITCACGNSFLTGSTKQTIQIEICAACHPFFTGEMKYVDTAGRVDKFKAKRQVAQKTGYVKKKDKKKAKIAAQQQAMQQAPQTLKEMMSHAKKQVQNQNKKSNKQTSSSSDQNSDKQDKDN